MAKAGTGEMKMAENRCDELFGKNGELTEYRRKQVLEGAFGIIQRHYEDKPNKMEAVAALFGKKLGEEFILRYYEAVVKAKFDSGGLLCYYEFDHEWSKNYKFFNFLCEGKAVIVDE